LNYYRGQGRGGGSTARKAKYSGPNSLEYEKGILGGEGRIGGYHEDIMVSLCLPVAEVIFNDTARCKILIDGSTTLRLTRHENYGKDRAIHQFHKLSGTHCFELHWPRKNSSLN